MIQAELGIKLLILTLQLWDVCSDQEAVDLVRNTQDPQAASKALVDHALARFSTDNLSCMIVRFDNKALQETVENIKTAAIGVEGDPATKHGGLSEAEQIVRDAKKNLGVTGDESLERITTEMLDEEEKREPGPELNVAALEAARKDNKPQPPAS